MILLEKSPLVPINRDQTMMRDAVVGALRLGHKLATYRMVDELAPFLDAVCADLKRAGYPPALCRIVLFFYDVRAVAEVTKRLVPGGGFVAHAQPRCWHELFDLLTEGKLYEVAERYEPEWAWRTEVTTNGVERHP